jgi:hypothetical protein
MGVRVACLWVIALAACYSPYEPECGFVCGTGGACPADYTCGSDNICRRNGSTAMCSTAPVEFDVQSAMATSSHEVQVVFTGPPNSTEAGSPASYSISGLTVTAATVSASTVTLETSPQAAMTYTVTVGSVTRASDGAGLTTSTATFAGRPAFDVASATAVGSHAISVVFDAAANGSQAMNASNYALSGGLTLAGAPPSLSTDGKTVTMGTSAQTATTFTVTVANVQRASDFEPLTVASAMFTGRAPFDVASAASTGALAMTVTFDAAPDMTQAQTAINYAVSGLVLSNAVLAGNTVTLTTSAQGVGTYTVTVANVTRASDAEPLTTSTAMFTGTSHCLDGVQDVDETDKDCGGAVCPKCAMGKMCINNTDCTSGVCASMICN